MSFFVPLTLLGMFKSSDLVLGMGKYSEYDDDEDEYEDELMLVSCSEC